MTLPLAGFAALATLWVGSAEFAAPWLPSGALLDGRRAALAGELPEAERALVYALDHGATDDPDRGLVLALAGRVAFEGGSYAVAATRFAAARAAAPEIADYLLASEARSLLADQRYDAAAAAYQQLLAHTPESPAAAGARFRLGDAHFGANAWEPALDAYERASRDAPNGWAAMIATFNMARAYEALGAWGQAVRAYRAVEVRYPGSFAATDASERAREVATRHRIALQPLPAATERSVAQRLVKSRSWNRALATYESAARHARGTLRAEIELELVDLLMRRRRFDEAEGRLDALVRQPAGVHPAALTEMRARIASARGEDARAISLYLKLAQRWPQRSEARDALMKAAWLAAERDNYAEAQRLYGHFRERYPADSAATEALWLHGWNAFLARDFPAARRAFDELGASVGPGSEYQAPATYWEARAAEEQGDNAGAVLRLRSLLDRTPLGYYALQAERRLARLTSDPAPLRPAEPAPADGGGDAVHDTPAPRRLADEPTALLPPPEELPEDGIVGTPRYDALTDELPPLIPPPFPRALDPTSPGTRRMRALAILGMPRDAVREGTERAPGQAGLVGATSADQRFERATLAAAFGDYFVSATTARTGIADTDVLRLTASNARLWRLAYPLAFPSDVARAAQRRGVSPLLVLAVMRQESLYAPRAHSWADARGLMQVLPITGRRIAERLGDPDFDEDDLFTPARGIDFGAWYLHELLYKFNGVLPYAIGSYNAGPKAMVRWIEAGPGTPLDVFIERIPYAETRRYVKRVLTHLHVYRSLYNHRATIALPEAVVVAYEDNISF